MQYRVYTVGTRAAMLEGMAKTKDKTPKQWLANYNKMDDPPECENHHFGCSCTAKPGGPCMNEMANLVAPDSDA